jgi:hypothetical protein
VTTYDPKRFHKQARFLAFRDADIRNRILDLQADDYLKSVVVPALPPPVDGHD